MTSATSAPALPEHYFRHEFGRLVAALARRFGVHRVELCEDAVQTAMMKAVTAWPPQGVPADPGAWLYRVATNEVLGAMRRDRRVEALADTIAEQIVDEPAPPDVYLPKEVEDAVLRMLFICCDPSLTRESQLVFALKVICGFSVEEIALRLFQQPDAVYKRVQRARQTLSGQVSGLDTPPLGALQERRPAVLQLIYLLFNEGYSSAQPDRVLRHDVCGEAIRLAWTLRAHPIGDIPATDALLALMYLNVARFAARVDGDGGLLLLEEQDRARWDRALVQQGMACLARASQGSEMSSYHLEAGIAAEHCLAETFAETRWDEIVRMYDMLDQVAPSPIHSLNRAIAVAEWKGAAQGLTLLRTLAPPPWLADYYLWHATLGELSRRSGDLEAARSHLGRALTGAPTYAEQALLARRLTLCGPTPE
jgi:RNA polymerase sigma factor (sigma-70 family)